MPKNGPQICNRNVLSPGQQYWESKQEVTVWGPRLMDTQEFFTWDIEASLEIGPIAQYEWGKATGDMCGSEGAHSFHFHSICSDSHTALPNGGRGCECRETEGELGL